MALEIGSVDADSGMSKAIYEEMNSLLAPPLEEAVNNAEDEAKAKAQEALDGARSGWKKLSYAIAKGLIEHIKSNMEIYGIETQGDVSTTIQGNTGLADPGGHQHSVDLIGDQIGMVSIQSNDGTGLVR